MNYLIFHFFVVVVVVVFFLVHSISVLTFKIKGTFWGSHIVIKVFAESL